jgi:hypothetical protein
MPIGIFYRFSRLYVKDSVMNSSLQISRTDLSDDI